MTHARKNMEQKNWTHLVTKHQRRVFSAAISITKNVDDANEVTQDVFVKLFSKIDGIKNRGAIGSWCVRTAFNLASDKMRYKRIRNWLQFKSSDIDNVPSREQNFENREMLIIVQKWISAKLTNRERVTLQLKTGEEMTFAEIAKSLNISESSAKTHYYRAINKLNALRKEGAHE